MSLRYVSTRGGVAPCGFEEALFAGLAGDGGLYLPERWPRLERDEVAALQGASYQEVAARILAPFVGEDIADADLRELIARAYGGFDHVAIAPLRQLGPNEWLLELFHGPTLAFKDIALQLLGLLFEHFLARRERVITIIGATSGDTGSAAIEACAGRAHMRIVILHPHGRISEVQRRQMTTVTAANVDNVAIEGTFDDCQALVKALFNDAALRRRLLAAVNSINWGRIMAQAVYYVTAALALGGPSRKVSFAVPSGNFGDIYAGYVAHRMGLPIAQLIVATNRNDILARFFASGTYSAGEVAPTMSPSMDIQVASNFERLLFDLCEGDGAEVARLLGKFAARKEPACAGRCPWPRARAVRCRPGRRGRDGEDDGGGIARERPAGGPAHRGRHPRRARLPARSEHADDRAGHGPSGQVSGRGGKGDRHQAAAARPPRRSAGATRALRRPAQRSGRSAAPHPRAGHGDRMSETTRITTLDSGLRVATETMASVQTASVGVWIDVGARYETPEVNGVAHMLEHMAFKGTERRSARAIAEAIENVGGHLNAYTSREHTAYYARVMADDLPLAAELLADILQHSIFDESELARERTVILQEIGQVQDTPDDLVFDLFQETAYPGQSLGRSILGPAEIVAAMPRTTLIDYMAHHYGPEHLVLAAAGKVEHERLVELAERLFRDLPAPAPHRPDDARYEGGERREERELEQAHLLLGLPAFSYRDDDFYALQVLSTMLGGGMSSRLFQEVRENRGLAYSVFSFASCYNDTGVLGIYAGTGEKETAELVPVVCDEFLKLIEEPGEDELARARAQLKASLMMGLESCFAQSEDLARQLLIFGRRIPQDEIIANIDAVDEAAIRRVGRRLRAGGAPTLTALGPLAQLPSLDSIRHRLQ